MISHTELRDMNWVALKDGDFVPIRCGGILAIQQERFECFPIPLTPEILERCGFEKGFGEYALIQDSYPLRFREEGEKYILSFHYFGSNGESNEEEIICEFKYLHQLQNLYFALTGQELEVNL